MKVFVVLVLGLLSAAYGMPRNDDLDEVKKEGTVHFFVVMVPESTVAELRKARQEEEAAAGIGETGVFVGQIIQGVLGGDVRPIFAGSASFIDEPEVQQGVSTILANVAPAANNILKQWYSRVQYALGITTTGRPGLNGTAPSNGQVAGQPQNGALQGQTQLTQQQPQVGGSNVYSSQEQQGQQQQQAPYEPKTVEPLPFINVKTEEDEDENKLKLDV